MGRFSVDYTKESYWLGRVQTIRKVWIMWGRLENLHRRD